MKLKYAAAALLALLSLQACGLKGDLYLDDPADQAEGQRTTDKGALDAGLEEDSSFDADPLDEVADIEAAPADMDSEGINPEQSGAEEAATEDTGE